MEQKTIPTEKNYNLSKVKLNPNGGLQADYHANVSRDIHPDLRGLFEDLRPIVARVFNITSFLTLLESDEMKLTESKKMAARQFANELVEKIDVRGVSWSGSDDNVGVVITAVFETPNGLKTCINTPRIKTAQISFGFEEEMEKITDAVKAEVYQFLFNGKQAQLSLFGADGEPAPAGVAGCPADGPAKDDLPEM